jgi:glycosyltransferase involved in cell wall biosynthesis
MIHKPIAYDRKYAKHRMRKEGIEYFSKKWGIEYMWNSWHKAWGKPNPMRIGFLIPNGKKLKYELKITEKKEIAIGIKTFFREKTLFKTLDAIEKYFPLSYRLYIADDGRISVEKEYRYQKLTNEGHEIIKLPFNCGISTGRNEIIKKVKEDYVLITDDDIELQDSNIIMNMKRVLDTKKDIGVCSGMLFSENGSFLASENYQKGVRFEIDRGMLFRYPSLHKIHKAGDSFYVYADQVVNFFLAKKAVFKDIKWDNKIKVEWEHLDFFLRLKETKWKVASCINTKATHLQSINDSDYNYHRRSISNNYFFNKHGIHRVINRF